MDGTPGPMPSSRLPPRGLPMACLGRPQVRRVRNALQFCNYSRLQSNPFVRPFFVAPHIRGARRVIWRSLEEAFPMFGLGTQELLVILVIVLVLFGANRLPQLARSLGSSLKEFKKGIDEGQAKESSVSPPSAERVSAPAVQRICGQCKNALAADWTHCP